MTAKQRGILEFIQKRFYPGSVETLPVKDDGIRITDRRGESMVLTVNDQGCIVDADTGIVYQFAEGRKDHGKNQNG